MEKILVILCVFLSVAILCQADVIDIPSDYATIQEGINASTNGDTVLVQPGTYIENINFNGKNITLGSLFLTTHDTSYISQTIIDGDSSGSVVTFTTGEDSTAILTGFTITNGYNMYKGAGIYIAGSDPIIKDVLITENNADYGGGVSCSFSNSTLINCVIDNNYCEKYGGGIYSFGNSINLLNVELTNNTSTNDNLLSYGGGIFFMFDSTSVLENVTISGNKSTYGGGVCVCFSSNPSFKNVTIKENKATSVGGGLFCNDSSYIVFDDTDRCNILLNNSNTRSNGADIATESAIQVIVDTFTVLNPTDYHALPVDSIGFDILHGRLEQVDADLYVAPWGDNNNSGLSPDQPVKTIQYASSIILADSLNHHTINLASGTYSTSTNGEFFPISLLNYVSLVGDTVGVIIDAENSASVFKLQNVDVELHNLTTQNGYARDGGGIYCYCSDLKVQNVQVINNQSLHDGGGIYSWNSDITLEKVVISQNETLNTYLHGGGGIYLNPYSKLYANNTTISYNYAAENAGGIYTESILGCSIQNSIISNNNKFGIYAHWSSGEIDISYSDFWNNEEGNFYGLNDSIGNNVIVNANGDSCDAFYNIQMDPLFVDPLSEDYHLHWGSPCIDAGDPNSPYDPDSTIADMGAYYYDQLMGADIPGQGDNALGLMNYPNPFRNSTTISFSIPKATKVKLQIFNLKGQLVEEVLNDDIQSGDRTLEWDSADYPSGVYFYKLATPNSSVIKKMVILK